MAKTHPVNSYDGEPAKAGTSLRALNQLELAPHDFWRVDVEAADFTEEDTRLTRKPLIYYSLVFKIWYDIALGTHISYAAAHLQITSHPIAVVSPTAMKCTAFPLRPTSLEEVTTAVRAALQSNYANARIEVAQCPDLRRAPFNLASEGLCGRPVIADIGGQPNLFPRPLLDKKYSMIDIAKDHMQMSLKQGMLIGAGAGPFHVVGQNSELAPNVAWKDAFDNVTNLTRYAKINKGSLSGSVACEKCPSTDCALMMNLFGSSGLPGEVIKVTARKRTGSTASFTDVIRFALHEHFGDARPVSLGGVFVIRKGKANFHVMPDFPPDNELPFDSREQLNDWLTYHDFSVYGDGKNDEIVCLSVLHSADPDKQMGLRMEHTHCFSLGDRGGHYHYDLEDEEVEYEGYFNVAETIYRVDRPEVTLQRDLHD